MTTTFIPALRARSVSSVARIAGLRHTAAGGRRRADLIEQPLKMIVRRTLTLWPLPVLAATALMLAGPVRAADLATYCTYQPNAPVSKGGAEVVQQTVTHSGPPKAGTQDVFQILLPKVTAPKTNYTGQGRAIALRKDDVLTFAACGCVQTGGSGDTWKLYVNPKGSNSDKFYHGGVVLDDAVQAGLPVSPTVKGMVRFSDLLAWQNNAANRVHVSKPGFLVLGYEDDEYRDNGYGKHDNGNDDQCKNFGGAAVQVTIDHN